MCFSILYSISHRGLSYAAVDLKCNRNLVMEPKLVLCPFNMIKQASERTSANKQRTTMPMTISFYSPTWLFIQWLLLPFLFCQHPECGRKKGMLEKRKCGGEESGGAGACLHTFSSTPFVCLKSSRWRVVLPANPPSGITGEEQNAKY